MSIVTHVMIGAAAGSLAPNAYLGAGAGFISHILGDLIPHYDPPLVAKRPRSALISAWYWLLLLIDFSLGLIVLWLVKDHPNLLWGGIVGGLVDLDTFFFHKLEAIGIPIHDQRSNWHKKTTLIKGLFNQGLLTLFAMVVLYFQLYSSIGR